MKRVLVTGATGFVGANLARRLVVDGHDVHLLVRPGLGPGSAAWRLDGLRAHSRLHHVDFASDPDGLDRVVGEIRPEWVFHLAAHGAYSSQTDLHRMAQTNVIGTMNLVQSCLRVGFEAFVNTGSSSEYGFKDHAPSETEWLEPNSHYAVTKAAATLFCRYTAQSQRVHLPTLRLYSVYGPWEEPSRLMPQLIVRGLRGELPPLVDPRIARDYVYADDVTEAYLLAADTADQEPGAVYNVGTGIQTSLGELVGLVREVLPVTAEPAWGSMPARGWDTAAWVADSRKIRDELGWTPRSTLEQGFRAMVEWFRGDPALLDLYRQREGRAIASGSRKS